MVIIVTAALVGRSAYLAGSAALRLPLLIAVCCIGFVAMMWFEAWRRRGNPEVTDVLVGFAAGVAGMSVLLADQMTRLAEYASNCAP